MFLLLKISWLVLAVACTVGFIKSIEIEDLHHETNIPIPGWLRLRKWFFVLVMLVSTGMVITVGMAIERLDATIDNATVNMQVKTVPYMPTVEHSGSPIQINFDNGKASWYDYCLPREKVSNDPCSYSKTHATAASTKWPRGTKLDVCVNDGTGRCVMVVVNDYGPEKAVFPNRIIDLSSFAFRQLGNLSAGIIDVDVMLHELL